MDISEMLTPVSVILTPLRFSFKEQIKLTFLQFPSQAWSLQVYPV